MSDLRQYTSKSNGFHIFILAESLLDAHKYGMSYYGTEFKTSTHISNSGEITLCDKGKAKRYVVKNEQ